MSAVIFHIADIVNEFETRLAESPFELVIPDRIVMPGGTQTGLAHRGISVLWKGNANLNGYRDQRLAQTEDVIEVTLTYRVSPKDQRESRSGAYTLAEQIRAYLTDRVWLADLHVTYRDAAPEHRAEWFVIPQTFTLSRDAALGG